MYLNFWILIQFYNSLTLRHFFLLQTNWQVCSHSGPISTLLNSKLLTVERTVGQQSRDLILSSSSSTCLANLTELLFHPLTHMLVSELLLASVTLYPHGSRVHAKPLRVVLLGTFPLFISIKKKQRIGSHVKQMQTQHSQNICQYFPLMFYY